MINIYKVLLPPPKEGCFMLDQHGCSTRASPLATVSEQSSHYLHDASRLQAPQVSAGVAMPGTRGPHGRAPCPPPGFPPAPSYPVHSRAAPRCTCPAAGRRRSPGPPHRAEARPREADIRFDGTSALRRSRLWMPTSLVPLPRRWS
jgi:hypothetical protein